MHILIAERLKPFLHRLKGSVILPGSPFFVEIYPALILVYSLAKNERELVSKIETSIIGPVNKFTVQLNLEKGHCQVFGEGKTGYFRYRLSSSLSGSELYLDVEKDSGSPLLFTQVSGDLSLRIGKNPIEILSAERLSLGNHKAQDFLLIKKRQDLKEIFPIWLKAGGFYPPMKPLKNEGTLALLEEVENAIKNRNINDLLSPFKTLFSAAFDGLLVPSLMDLTHQGLKLPKVLTPQSPLVLLSYGAKLIRSLFLHFEKNTLTILPALPKEFHSGRFLHLELPGVGTLDLEWSKKTVRRLILFATNSCSFDLKLSKDIKRFRLGSDNSPSEWVKALTLIKVEKGKTYFFDRFEK